MTKVTQTERPRKVRFGLFEADLATGELRRSGSKVRIQSQPFKLLAALLEHPGTVVTRETLQHLLWGKDTTVDFDHGLGIAVNKLREALGDSADNPRFVETLAKRGYRFIAPVQVVEPLPVAPLVPASTPPPTPVTCDRSRRPWYWTTAVLGAICVFLGLSLVLRPAERSPYHIDQVTNSGQVLSNEPEVGSFSASVSDGTRLYFTHMQNGTPELAVALISNGEISHLQLPSEIGAPLISALSPDGSKLIVHGHLQAAPEQPLWIVPTLGGNSRKVPNLTAHDATWMPDGSHLLAASGNDLVVADQDGSDVHRLLTMPGLAFWLRWSPDGKRLRFTLRNPKQQTSELWEVAADGSHPHPLLPGWNHPAAECCGSWTADGESFVFQSFRNNHNQIWQIRDNAWLGGSRPHLVTNGPLDFEAPSAIPGGHRINFIGVDVHYELLSALPHSPAFASLNQNLNAAALVSYSNDGAWVAWLDAAGGSLWRSRADGSERIELTTPPLRIFTMRWSPDNKRLALMAEEPGKPWKIYLIDADGGRPQPLLNEERNEADPNWSADGKMLVFGRLPDRMDSAPPPKAIYLLNLETHRVTEVPGSPGLFSPRLSPDGRRIVAIRLDQHALLLFDRSSQRWQTLTTHGVGDPFWSHDGKFVYFQDFLESGKPIYRISVAGGQVEQVATIGNLLPVAASDYRLIGLAPGDQPIVTARTSTVNLYSIDFSER